MDIEKKIKELRLLPLFPDKNFAYSTFKLEDGGDAIKIEDLRDEVNLRFTITLYYAKNNDTTKKYVVLGRVYNYENGEDYLNLTKTYEQSGFYDALNNFNAIYEELAKKFNELLLDELKKDLEKEKQKAKEEEEKYKEESKGGDGQDSEEDSEGQDESGQGGGGQDSEEDSEGQGGGDGENMSSEDIQKFIDQLNKQLDNSDSSGQSNDSGIDLEDFLEKVNDGKVDNDFTKNYNNQDLKREIDEEKRDVNPMPTFDENYMDAFDENPTKPVYQVLKEKLNVDDFELKRRFPNPDFVKDFINSLSKKEVDDLSGKVGIEESLTTLDKKNKLSVNLITEIQNL